MELFWQRLEAQLPPPEREEARWIVGGSVVERNEEAAQQIRCLTELLAETKKSLVAADIARLEGGIRDLRIRFTQKAEATGLPVDKLLPKLTDREQRIWLALTSQASFKETPSLRDSDLLLRQCGDLDSVERLEKELREALDAEYVWLEFEAERLQSTLGSRVHEHHYFTELQALQRKLEKEVIREISVALMTPLQKKREAAVSTAASSQEVADLEESAVEAFDSGTAIAISTRALFARLYPVRPTSSSSEDRETKPEQSSYEEEDLQPRPVSKASLRLRKMVETHREAPDLSWR